MKVTELCWVHVEYGSKRSGGFEWRRRIIELALGVTCKVVIVQNDLLTDLVQPQAVRGSNRLREFSGWNEGVGVAREQGYVPAWWLLSNDTFSHHRFFWGTILIGLALAFRGAKKRTDPIIIGDILPGNATSCYNGCALYVSTYLFLANSAAMDRLSWSFTEGAPLNWIARDEGNTLVTSECPETARAFLEDHVCNPASPKAWRDAAPVTQDNREFLRSKARAVILEHSFSNRAAFAGVSFVSVIERKSINLLRLLRSVECRITAVLNSIR